MTYTLLDSLVSRWWDKSNAVQRAGRTESIPYVSGEVCHYSCLHFVGANIGLRCHHMLIVEAGGFRLNKHLPRSGARAQRDLETLPGSALSDEEGRTAG